ncbi:hypothetical protein PSHT_08483 [Puccinia striiformis]|uniref:Uncharacterized protein n=1 Tax=Puccinia striiformis TaxID=27350 RepID=A0A2S4VP32_9BASI|nr:hypothetical protein PSHT_08483 [Puccinia striiformis]
MPPKRNTTQTGELSRHTSPGLQDVTILDRNSNNHLDLRVICNSCATATIQTSSPTSARSVVGCVLTDRKSPAKDGNQHHQRDVKSCEQQSTSSLPTRNKRIKLEGTEKMNAPAVEDHTYLVIDIEHQMRIMKAEIGALRRRIIFIKHLEDMGYSPSKINDLMIKQFDQGDGSNNPHEEMEPLLLSHENDTEKDDIKPLIVKL